MICNWVQCNRAFIIRFWCMVCERNSRIPKEQTEIVKSEDKQDYGQQNETKDKKGTHNTPLKTKAGVTRTLQKPG